MGAHLGGFGHAFAKDFDFEVADVGVQLGRGLAVDLLEAGDRGI